MKRTEGESRLFSIVSHRHVSIFPLGLRCLGGTSRYEVRFKELLKDPVLDLCAYLRAALPHCMTDATPSSSGQPPRPPPSKVSSGSTAELQPRGVAGAAAESGAMGAALPAFRRATDLLADAAAISQPAERGDPCSQTTRASARNPLLAPPSGQPSRQVLSALSPPSTPSHTARSGDAAAVVDELAAESAEDERTARAVEERDEYQQRSEALAGLGRSGASTETESAAAETADDFEEGGGWGWDTSGQVAASSGASASTSAERSRQGTAGGSAATAITILDDDPDDESEASTTAIGTTGAIGRSAAREARPAARAPATGCRKATSVCLQTVLAFRPAGGGAAASGGGAGTGKSACPTLCGTLPPPAPPPKAKRPNPGGGSGSAIVYTHTRADAEDIASALSAHGIPAEGAVVVGEEGKELGGDGDEDHIRALVHHSS